MVSSSGVGFTIDLKLFWIKATNLRFIGRFGSWVGKYRTPEHASGLGFSSQLAP